MTGVLDLVCLAARLDRSYSWTQRHWRTHRHPATGVLLPRPFVGGGPREWPRWSAETIEAWKAGAPAGAETSGDLAQRAPDAAAANDPIQRRPQGRAQALIAAAGGR